MPFRRDPDFVSREELDTVNEKLSIPAARVALVGLGGVGYAASSTGTKMLAGSHSLLLSIPTVLESARLRRGSYGYMQAT